MAGPSCHDLQRHILRKHIPACYLIRTHLSMLLSPGLFVYLTQHLDGDVLALVDLHTRREIRLQTAPTGLNQYCTQLLCNGLSKW